MSEELKNTLIEVRKAYRLIYLYQYYVFDIVRKIVEEFGNPKFYCWDTQHYEKPPPLTSSPLDRWTWDMLPTYDLSLLFLSVGADTNRQRQGDWLLEIRVVADDGFELQGSTEPDPTKFRSPEACGSYIKLCFSYCSRDSRFNWYHDMWTAASYPKEDETVVEEENGVGTISKTYEMSSMSDENSIIKNVKEFKELLRTKLQLANI